MLLEKCLAYTWPSATEPRPAGVFHTMTYACPNQDGSYVGPNTTAVSRELSRLPPGRRVILFQGMVGSLYGFEGDVPPFYNKGAAHYQPLVNQFFSTLKRLGPGQIDAVVPDVEGALANWQMSDAHCAAILAHPSGDRFLADLGYTGRRDARDLNYWIHTHLEATQPVLLRYADDYLYEAVKPLRELYGDVLIQKWSIGVPPPAARIASLPQSGGTTATYAFRSSFAQCDELYGGKAPAPAYPDDVWTGQRIADTWITRLMAAKASRPDKPLIPWVAAKSYNYSPKPGGAPWANTPAYDYFLDNILPLTDGRLLYARNISPVTDADDSAISDAINRYAASLR